MKLEERVNPIVITDTETNRKYTLDFNRETVRFAEERGFSWDEVGDKPATMVPLIWYTAFRRYDSRISLDKTTKLLEDLGGMKPSWVVRLRELYNQALTSLIAQDTAEGEEEEAKNARLTVEL